jgi:hypothetical protein
VFGSVAFLFLFLDLVFALAMDFVFVLVVRFWFWCFLSFLLSRTIHILPLDLLLNKIGEYIRRILDCFDVQIGASGVEVCLFLSCFIFIVLCS